jgi:two-component system copper resistance phosphate regulon response regulator CusR
MKLLIAEDEPKVGMYLRQGLTEAGYIVDLVTSGTDALHQLWTGRSQDRSATLS